MGEHMQAMKAVVDNRGNVQPLAATVDDMIAWYRTMPQRFPPGSDRGDTRALPAIWTERANFETINSNMVEPIAGPAGRRGVRRRRRLRQRLRPNGPNLRNLPPPLPRPGPLTGRAAAARFSRAG